MFLYINTANKPLASIYQGVVKTNDLASVSLALLAELETIERINKLYNKLANATGATKMEHP